MTDTLSPQAQLEAVRAKIVEASAGVRYRQCIACLKVHDGSKRGYCECGAFLGSNCPIRSRDIRLADVLLALNHAASYEVWGAAKDTFGYCYIGTEEDGRTQYCQWNLRSDSLDSQSPETIAFLYSLLCSE